MNLGNGTGLCIAVFFIVVCALVGVYDSWVVIVQPENYRSVSEWLVAWSSKYPILPLEIGILVGHLFFPSGR